MFMQVLKNAMFIMALIRWRQLKRTFHSNQLRAQKEMLQAHAIDCLYRSLGGSLRPSSLPSSPSSVSLSRT